VQTISPRAAHRRDSRRPSHPAPSGLVRFGLARAARQIYLLIGAAGAAKALLQMEPRGSDRWRLTLRLTPGAYRYRYYSVNDRVTTCSPPADSDDAPVRLSRSDAVLHVSADTCQTAAVPRVRCVAV
jgi:hypothetical protein